MLPNIVPMYAFPTEMAILPGARGAAAVTTVTGDETEAVMPPSKSQVKQSMTAREAGISAEKAAGMQWDMTGFLRQCVDVYIKLAGPNGPKLRTVVSPYIDQKAESEAEAAVKGALAPVASRILMKVLYAARMARFDLLRAVCHLACFTTKWTPECDRRLHRLACYTHSTKRYRLAGWVGDPVCYRAAPLC
jgi:hypothetical protein